MNQSQVPDEMIPGKHDRRICYTIFTLIFLCNLYNSVFAALSLFVVYRLAQLLTEKDLFEQFKSTHEKDARLLFVYQRGFRRGAGRGTPEDFAADVEECSEFLKDPDEHRLLGFPHCMYPESSMIEGTELLRARHGWDIFHGSDPGFLAAIPSHPHLSSPIIDLASCWWVLIRRNHWPEPGLVPSTLFSTEDQIN